uniref:Transmembrane protein n=1 Tax=Solibacter usitatus (strain Ellin6076) TaxID=234267 RepID=Q01SI3_SOLUE
MKFASSARRLKMQNPAALSGQAGFTIHQSGRPGYLDWLAPLSFFSCFLLFLVFLVFLVVSFVVSFAGGVVGVLGGVCGVCAKVSGNVATARAKASKLFFIFDSPCGQSPAYKSILRLQRRKLDSLHRLDTAPNSRVCRLMFFSLAS